MTVTTKKTILALALVALGFSGCNDPLPPPKNAEEAAVRQQGDIKYNLSIPAGATNVALLPGETNWATYTLEIDGKPRRFLYYRSFGDNAVMGLTELNP
jgi:hypothetical protein